jgi:DNA-binding XRE family transcriptional regulator
LEQKKEENLVKKTCKELGITQKELAEKIGVTQHTITNWSKGKMEKYAKSLLEAIIYQDRYFKLVSNIENEIKFSKGI